MNERCAKISQLLSHLDENVDSLMSQMEYEEVARKALNTTYPTIARETFECFNSIMNPCNAITDCGHHQIAGIVSKVREFSGIDLNRTAKIMVEANGDLYSIRQRGDSWIYIGPTINCINSIEPTDFDHEHRGRMYGFNCNAEVTYDEAKGLKISEKLPEDAKVALHEHVNRLDWIQFIDAWLNEDVFDLTPANVVIYAHALTDEAGRVLIEYNKRDGFRYKRNGDLKDDPTMPSDLLLVPTTTEERDEITSACLKEGDASVRAAHNAIDLHRIGADHIYMVATGLIDLVESTDRITKSNGKKYLFCRITGSVGVEGESCSKLGMKLNIITGKGLSSERTGWASDSYRGRIGAEEGVLMCLTNTSARPPNTDGHRLIHVDNVLPEGLKALKCLKVRKNVSQINHKQI